MLDDSEHKTVNVQNYRLTRQIQNRQQVYVEQLRIQESTCIQTRTNDSKQGIINKLKILCKNNCKD